MLVEIEIIGDQKQITSIIPAGYSHDTRMRVSGKCHTVHVIKEIGEIMPQLRANKSNLYFANGEIYHISIEIASRMMGRN